jgi:hypothetical protein
MLSSPESAIIALICHHPENKRFLSQLSKVLQTPSQLQMLLGDGNICIVISE